MLLENAFEGEIITSVKLFYGKSSDASGSIWDASFSHIRELVIISCDDMQGSLEALEREISAAIISKIGFKKTHLEDEHVRRLFSLGRRFPRLKILDLSDTRITEDSLQILVQSRILASLIDLRLRGVQGSSGHFISLMKSCILLKRMSFSGCKKFKN